MAAGQDITLKVEDLYDPSILANFSGFAEKKAKKDKARMYTIISNIAYLMEYGRLRDESPLNITLDDESIFFHMDFSAYKPETKISEQQLESIGNNWSRKRKQLGYFPLYSNERVKNIGELAAKIFKITGL
jgi:hypothetical protein